MATLMQFTLELVGPDADVSVVGAQADRREVDAGVKTMATGGLEGAMNAINAVIRPQGYEIRRVREAAMRLGE